MSNPVCKVCGDDLPKYRLDRYADGLCGYGCDRAARAAAVAFGLMGMFEEIRASLAEDCCDCGAEQESPRPGPYLCARCA